MKKAILLALVLEFCLVTEQAKADFIWTQKGDMPTPRWGHTSAVVNGKIYVIGGGASEGPDERVLSVVEEYDPVTNTWTTKADMPTARFGLSTCVVNAKIYAIGGDSWPSVVRSAVEEYDPATDTWTRKTDIPTGRDYLATVAVDEKIYAIGGTLSYSSGFPTVEVYDPATDTWTTKADMSTRLWGLCAHMVNGKIYTFGGRPGLQAIARVQEYDPATDTWTRKADMPVATSQMDSVVLGDKIIVIGGWLWSMNDPYTTVQMYDPQTDTWTIEADVPFQRAVFSADVVNNRIYAIGGTYKRHPCPATSTVYELTINPPPPDFNSDGIIDSKDVCIMVEYWGTDEPLCDIAPPPFGDGIVDVQDLILLSEHLFSDYYTLAHWKLDEKTGNTAYDYVGGRDSTLYGEPLWQPRGGQIIGALEFDGIDDYVDTPFILDPGKGSLSAFAWIKGGQPGQAVISQTGAFGGTWLGIDSTESTLMTGFSGMYFGDLVSEAIITDGQWHHVGFVYDLDTLHRRLYVDGAQVAEDATVVSGMPSDGGLYIGASKDLDAGTFFSGMIDDVRIYNQALSAEEIETLAN